MHRLAGVIFSLRVVITVQGGNGNGVGVDRLCISCMTFTDAVRMLITSHQYCLQTVNNDGSGFDCVAAVSKSL